MLYQQIGDRKWIITLAVRRLIQQRGNRKIIHLAYYTNADPYTNFGMTLSSVVNRQ